MEDVKVKIEPVENQEPEAKKRKADTETDNTVPMSEAKKIKVETEIDTTIVKSEVNNDVSESETNKPAENQDKETKKRKLDSETGSLVPKSEPNGAVSESETNKPVENQEPESKKQKLDSEPKVETNNTVVKLEDAELSKKVLRQIEYYFGDNNMRRDRFLIDQTKLDNGWVPMTVMLNFKVLASMTTDVEFILKSLESSDLIEISEDRKKIRRSLEKPLPKYDGDYLKSQEAKTIYLKGFPLTMTMEELLEHYNSPHIENVIMRKYTKDKKKYFKGSIFLQFKTLEAAKAFMEQESIKYNDTELIKMWSNDYNAIKEKEKEEKQQKKIKSILSGESESKGKNDNNKEPKKKKNFARGCVFHISNIPKEFTREVIKNKVSEISEVAYIDHKTGNTEGWVRLVGENSAVEMFKKLDDNKIKINDTEIICKLLEGEEEDTYFVKVEEDMNQRFKRRDGGGRKGRRNQKRRHSPNREDNGKRMRS